jgi:hypothetical protein
MECRVKVLCTYMLCSGCFLCLSDKTGETSWMHVAKYPDEFLFL